MVTGDSLSTGVSAIEGEMSSEIDWFRFSTSSASVLAASLGVMLLNAGLCK